jgi:excisionase family DNA binding protein
MRQHDSVKASSIQSEKLQDGTDILSANPLLTMREAAAALRVSYRTICRMTAADELSVVRIRGSVRIPLSAVEAAKQPKPKPQVQHDADGSDDDEQARIKNAIATTRAERAAVSARMQEAANLMHIRRAARRFRDS